MEACSVGSVFSVTAQELTIASHHGQHWQTRNGNQNKTVISTFWATTEFFGLVVFRGRDNDWWLRKKHFYFLQQLYSSDEI